MTEAEFNEIKTACERWSDRSLNIVKAYLVEGKKLSDIEVAFNVKKQQVTVLSKRFVDKRLKTFMDSETPKNKKKSLASCKNHIKVLVKNGYSVDQILKYLKSVGVDADVAELLKFTKVDV